MTSRDTVGDGRRYELAMRYFLMGQVGFFAALLVCIVLLPRGLSANHGFSYFGEHPLTVVPYRLAFLLSGIFTVLSAFRLPDTPPFRVVKLIFLLMLPFLLGLVLTTTSVTRLISRIHVTIGITLFVLQFAFGCWLAIFVRVSPRHTALLCLQFLGGIVSLISLFWVIPCLLQGQILFQLAFGALTISSLLALRATAVAER